MTRTLPNLPSPGLETKTSRAESSRWNWPKRRLTQWDTAVAEEVVVAEVAAWEEVEEAVAEAEVHPATPARATGSVPSQNVATTTSLGGMSATGARPQGLKEWAGEMVETSEVVSMEDVEEIEAEVA